MQEPSGPPGNHARGGGGDGSKDTPNEAMVKEQHAELLAELPVDQQLVRAQIAPCRMLFAFLRTLIAPAGFLLAFILGTGDDQSPPELRAA
eukprot:1045176-Pelagomonas_calceolata.AAC.3